LAIGIVQAARHDVDRMVAGSLDPQGHEHICRARRRAVLGLILNLIGLTIFLVTCWLMLPWVIFGAVG
jgi:hypothetical protein